MHQRRICKVNNVSLMIGPAPDHDGGCQPEKDGTSNPSSVKYLCDVTESQSSPSRQVVEPRLFEIPTIHQTRNTTTIATIDPIFEPPSSPTSVIDCPMSSEPMSTAEFYALISKRFDKLDERFDGLEDQVDELTKVVHDGFARVELSKARTYAKQFTVSVEVPDALIEGKYGSFGHGILVEEEETDENGDPTTVWRVLTCGHVGVEIYASKSSHLQLVFVGATPKKAIKCTLVGPLFLTKEYVESNATDLCMMQISTDTDFGSQKGFGKKLVEWELPENVRGLELIGQSSVHMRGSAILLKPPERARLMMSGYGIPGSSGTLLFHERDGEVRLVALVKGIARSDLIGSYHESVSMKDARNYIHADGKGAGNLTFFKVKVEHVADLKDYIKWRNTKGVKGSTKIDASIIVKLRRHRRHLKTSKNPCKAFLDEDITVCIDTIMCVLWTDEATQSANAAVGIAAEAVTVRRKTRKSKKKSRAYTAGRLKSDANVVDAHRKKSRDIVLESLPARSCVEGARNDEQKEELTVIDYDDTFENDPATCADNRLEEIVDDSEVTTTASVVDDSEVTTTASEAGRPAKRSKPKPNDDHPHGMK